MAQSGSNSGSSSSSSSTHHVIVLLEKLFPSTPVFDLPEPHTYEVREYERTLPGELAGRIRDAEVIVRAVVPVGAGALSAAVSPALRMVAVVGSGTDPVDLGACRARGVLVANTPRCNTSAVAEHALGLYLSLRRSIPRTHRLTQAGEWARRGALPGVLDGPDGCAPRACRDEVVGIFGHGGVGQKVDALARALGMKVLISGRKGEPEVPRHAGPPGRTPFDQVIRAASVLVLCLPKTPHTINYISGAELEAMQPQAVLVNVSRGGIVDEEALVTALERGNIAGAATDVYVKEPVGEGDSPLVGPRVQDLNLVTTPHTAWVSRETNANYLETLRANIAAYIAGEPANVVN